jgi:hypothetical protein
LSCDQYSKCCVVVTDGLDMEARASAAATLGTICQNNLTSQQVVFESGALDRLSAIFLGTSNGTLQSKVLYAMSCLSRGYIIAEERFVNEYATRVFQVVAASDVNANASLWSRGLYFASALISSDSSSNARNAVIAPLFVDAHAILQCLRCDNVDTREAMIHYVNTVLNSVGGALVINPHRAALHTALAERETQMQSDDFSKSSGEDNGDDTSANVAQVRHEQELLSDIIAQLDGRRRIQSGAVPQSPSLLLGPATSN